MTSPQDVNAALMGGGGRAAKFESVGDTTVGYVVRTEMRQRTELGTSRLMTWPDGNPRMQLVVTLSTEEHTDEDDDGMRNLYVAVPSQMQKAIADAIRKTGERGIGINGKLGVKFVKVDEPKQRNFHGQKIYTAKYEAPVQSLDYDEEAPPYDDEALPF